MEIKNLNGEVILKLESTTLLGADLRGADLYGADLRGADLRDADLYGAKNIKSLFQSSLAILKNQKGKLIAYKYLRKNYQSPYQNFEYEIGKTYNFPADADVTKLCSNGCNVATLEWCLRETGCDLDNYVYVECEFNACDVIIPYNSDGKFRINGDVTLVRELKKKEVKEAIYNVNEVKK